MGMKETTAEPAHLGFRPPLNLWRLFAGGHFRRCGERCYFAELPTYGKIGVVLATRKYGDKNYALIKADRDRLMAAKRGGRLNVAYVAGVMINEAEEVGWASFDGEISLELLEIEGLGEPSLLIGGNKAFELPAWTFGRKRKKAFNLPLEIEQFDSAF